MFRDVIERAGEHQRPLLVAIAQRDLAYLLAREGNLEGAKEEAQAARATFHRLGAKVEIEKLDALLAHPDFVEPRPALKETVEMPVVTDIAAARRSRERSTPKDETPGPA